MVLAYRMLRKMLNRIRTLLFCISDVDHSAGGVRNFVPASKYFRAQETNELLGVLTAASVLYLF